MPPPPRGRRPVVVHTVTTAPMSLAEDTQMRMRRYLITMAVRTACFVLAVVVDSWIRWVFAVGGIVLPYVAVVLANAVGPRWGARISGVDKYAAAGPGLHGAAASSMGAIDESERPA